MQIYEMLLWELSVGEFFTLPNPEKCLSHKDNSPYVVILLTLVTCLDHTNLISV